MLKFNVYNALTDKSSGGSRWYFSNCSNFSNFSKVPPLLDWLFKIDLDLNLRDLVNFKNTENQRVQYRHTQNLWWKHVLCLKILRILADFGEISQIWNFSNFRLSNIFLKLLSAILALLFIVSEQKQRYFSKVCFTLNLPYEMPRS